MTRVTPLLACAALAAVGCRSFEERPALFPRLRDALDGDRADDRYADRFRDRHTLPPAVMPAGSCVPCSGAGMGYPSGLTLGTPSVGGGYALPAGYSSPMTYAGPPVYSGTTVPSYSSAPVLGPPVYSGTAGTPVRPQRDDELPPPGGYSPPGATDMGRSVAPKPPGLPAGR